MHPIRYRRPPQQAGRFVSRTPIKPGVSASVGAHASIPWSKPMAIMLALLAFSAYMTETKFLAGFANNIGLFEVMTASLLITAFVFFYRNGIRLRLHGGIYILMALITVAAISTVKLPPQNQFSGLAQLAILIFGLLLVIAVYNILLLDEKYFDLFLRCIAYSAVIAAFWVILDQIASGGSYSAAGPFRSRAHTGIILLTSFWITLFFAFKTSKSTWERIFFFWIALPMMFYCIAVSLRQSVYVALGLGLIGLFIGIFLARSRKKFSILAPLVAVAVFGILIYGFFGDDWQPIQIFRIAADATELEIQKYFISSDVVTDRFESFSALQRRGVLDAVGDHPLLGLGWAGFWRSDYSPTGHEVHSTPLRFLAETGIIGFLLYLLLMGRLVFGSLIVWIRTRKTVYGLASLVLFVGLCSLSVSHIYNRSITERTFWLMMTIILVYDTFIRRQLQIAKQQRQQQQAAHKRLAHRAPIRPAHS